MSKKWIPFLPAALGLSLLMSGCATESSDEVLRVRTPATPNFPTGELVIREKAQEPERTYVTDVADQEHCWVESYWTPSQGMWVWIPGHWE